MAYQNARPCIAKRITSVKKVMYAIFFTPNRLAIQISIPKGKSMNTRFYRNKVLRKFVKFYQKCWPKICICGIYLWHDNASSHKVGSVASLLERTGGLCSRTFTLFPWSSPLWLFSLPSSQEKSCWQKYTSRQKLCISILNLLRGIPQKDYEEVFKNWIKNLKICVSVKGWYFDNLK